MSHLSLRAAEGGEAISLCREKRLLRSLRSLAMTFSSKCDIVKVGSLVAGGELSTTTVAVQGIQRAD
jgi:hypothetical protein